MGIDDSGHVHDDQSKLAKSRSKCALATYLCDFEEAVSLQSSSVLASLVKQIVLELGQAKVPKFMLDRLEDTIQHRRHSDFEELEKLFFEMVRLLNEVCVILDGIDECHPTSQREIAGFCVRAAAFAETNISVYVSSRDEFFLKDKFQAFPSLILGGKESTYDLGLFICERVQKMRSEGQLNFVSNSLSEKLTRRLSEKADGM